MFCWFSLHEKNFVKGAAGNLLLLFKCRKRVRSKTCYISSLQIPNPLLFCYEIPRFTFLTPLYYKMKICTILVTKYQLRNQCCTRILHEKFPNKTRIVQIIIWLKMTRETPEVRFDKKFNLIWIWYLTFFIWHLTFLIWHSSLDIFHLVFDIWHLTVDIWHLKFDIWQSIIDIWNLTVYIQHSKIDNWRSTFASCDINCIDTV